MPVGCAELTGRPLRILIDARMVGPRMHGIARYVVDLARGLARLGQEVHLLAAGEEAAARVGPGSVAGVVPCRVPFASPTESLRLGRYVRPDRFDVVHFPSFAVPLRPPPNAVVTIHDLIHLHPPSTLAHRAYYRRVLAPALGKAAAVIAVSAWTREELVERLGVEEAKVRVVRNGVDRAWEAAQTLPAPAVEKPYLLCTANPKPHKNAAAAVEGCRRACEGGADFRLVLALGGAPWPRARRLRSALRSRLVLPGPLGDAEIAALVGHAAAVICPGRLEGFDYPLAEALAAGARVLASDIPVHREFTGDRLAFYGPPDDAGALSARILEILCAPAPAERSHNVESVESMATATLAVYREAAGRRRA